MYSLDINFLNDRPEYQKINPKKPDKQPIQLGDFIPVYIGLGAKLLKSNGLL